MSSHFYGLTDLKYLTFGLALVYVILLFAFGETKFRLNYIWGLVLFLFVYAVIQLPFNNNTLIRFLKEWIFFISPIASVGLLVSTGSLIKKDNLIKLFFDISSLVYGFFLLLKFDALLRLNLLDVIIFSRSPVESLAGFTFGVFLLHFLINKDYKRVLIALIFVLLASKRIVYIGVIISFIFYTLQGAKQYRKITIMFAGIIVNIIIAFFMYNLAEGDYDALISRLTGLPANQVLTGRLFVYRDVVNLVGRPSLLGEGLGYTSTIIQSGFTRTNINLLHSDVLKLVIEIGLLGSVIYTLALYYIGAKGNYILAMIIYYNILCLSDNVTIYFEVLFTVFLLSYYNYIKHGSNISYRV